MSCDSVTDTPVNHADIDSLTSVVAITNDSSQQSILDHSQLQQDDKGDSEEDFYRTETLYNGKLKVSVPKDFKEMPDAIIPVKYPNAKNRPDIIFTNEKNSVNLVFTHSSVLATDDDLPEVQTALAAQLQATAPENFISRIETINNSRYIVYEFISKAVDTKIYNLMFVTVLSGKLLIGTFNCTEVLENEWKSKGKLVMNSIQKL